MAIPLNRSCLLFTPVSLAPGTAPDTFLELSKGSGWTVSQTLYRHNITCPYVHFTNEETKSEELNWSKVIQLVSSSDCLGVLNNPSERVMLIFWFVFQWRLFRNCRRQRRFWLMKRVELAMTTGEGARLRCHSSSGKLWVTRWKW